ncbi:hypothetical protein GCM10011499_03770 [Pelagibacterium lentulum]|uniref:Uncharacterized protein n=1 Tax=Pelagibacterium lentulum TaxID=2029865 RepID=A0A916VUM3_9HYPH|nr:hypothetical protein GCM10011499_03770 [Pelagibacterium lentulum]
MPVAGLGWLYKEVHCLLQASSLVASEIYFCRFWESVGVYPAYANGPKARHKRQLEKEIAR